MICSKDGTEASGKGGFTRQILSDPQQITACTKLTSQAGTASEYESICSKKHVWVDDIVEGDGCMRHAESDTGPQCNSCGVPWHATISQPVIDDSSDRHGPHIEWELPYVCCSSGWICMLLGRGVLWRIRYRQY